MEEWKYLFINLLISYNLTDSICVLHTETCVHSLIGYVSKLDKASGEWSTYL